MILDSEAAASCTWGVTETNALWSGQAVSGTLLERDVATATPSVSNSVDFKVIVLLVVGIDAHSLVVFPVAYVVFLCNQWVDFTHPIASWAGSSCSWSLSPGVMPGCLILMNIDLHVIFNSQATSSESTRVVDSNATWSLITVSSAFVNRDDAALSPAISDSKHFPVVIEVIVTVNTCSLDGLPVAWSAPRSLSHYHVPLF